MSGFGLRAAAAELTLSPDAPDRYVVVPGDTLWSISGRFLKDPWRWPQLFQLNRDQIRNPHRIYPGDIVVLDRSGRRARVVQNEVRVVPRSRIEAREAAAIPSIPQSAIEPFLSQPLMIDQSALDQAPRIVATEENRVAVAAGSRAYARGIEPGTGDFFQIYRPGGTLIDPDSKETLGFEAVYLGDARVVRAGEVSLLEIVRSNQEMYVGDRMFAAPKASFPSYVPRAPAKSVQGRVLAAYGGLAEVGSNSIMTLNKGTRDGIEVGHVLGVFRSSEFNQLRSGHESERIVSSLRETPLWGRVGPAGRDNSILAAAPETNLPLERHALVFVFRTFEKVSYALVMQASAPVTVLDHVRNP